MAPNVGPGIESYGKHNLKEWSTLLDWDRNSEFNEEPICGYCITEKWIYHTSLYLFIADLKTIFGKLSQIRVKHISIHLQSLCDHFWVLRHLDPARSHYPLCWCQSPVREARGYEISSWFWDQLASSWGPWWLCVPSWWWLGREWYEFGKRRYSTGNHL